MHCKIYELLFIVMMLPLKEFVYIYYYIYIVFAVI